MEKAYECLKGHPHFRGLRLNIEIHYEESVLMLEGLLPSFYLKQILQTVLRDLDGVSKIQNDVDVFYPRDPSSCIDSLSQKGTNDVENES